MDLRHLRYFLAVVDEGGFRRASHVLYVAQPAVSRTLRQLEQELGVSLFNRSATGVELTDAGLELVEHARTLLASADVARDAMRAHADRSAVLRIGAGPLCASELTEPIMRRFLAAHEGLRTDVRGVSFCDQIGGVVSGDVDVALVRGPVDHPDLEVTPIASEPRSLMVGLQHELAGETSVDVDDVLVDPTVPLDAPADWAFFWQLDDLRGRPNRLSGVAPATTIGSMRRAIAAGTSIITVPDSMRRIAPSPLTSCVRLTGAAPSTIAVVRRRRDRRATVTDFVERAAETAERHIELLPGGRVIR